MKSGKLKKVILGYWFKVHDNWRLYKLRRQFPLNIMTAEQTISYIRKYRCSIARFGDGEFGIMLGRSGPDFQNVSKEMAAAIENVFENTSSNLLICLPRAFISTKGFETFAKQFWRGWSSNNLKDVSQAISKHMGNDYRFGDAYISRPYTAYKSKRYATKMFSILKTLWFEKDILIVEGMKTRLGVGNDLFDDAKSIKRILGPAENAFDRYSNILDEIRSSWQGELVILALGPTATILASDLSKQGIQALDLGHIDIQYEWYLKGSKDFKPVPGKYTNEAVGGQQVEEWTDENYTAQIIATID